MKKNILLVAQGHNHALMQSHSLNASQMSWVAGSAPTDDFSCSAKTRYRQKEGF